MNQNDSLKWYQDHTEEFIARTADVDMTPHYSRFLEQVVPGGRILDLGCGAGKASLYFTQKGYQVLAVDGCQELCDFTRQRVGCPVRQMFFEELDYTDAFDAVWACASLLHVCKADLPDIFCRIHRALKTGGSLYFEINPLKAQAMETLLIEAGYHDVELRSDIFGKQRMIKAIL